jgi:multidrug efflux pump subunit AcrB
MSVRGFLFAAVVAGFALMAPSFARAQGQFDPAQFRERMMNNIKERLGASDDEWKVLEPKVEKVMTAQRDARAGGGFGGFGGRRGGGGGDQQPTTEIGKASADLRTALENKDTPADEIAKKLAAFREARDKARAQLQASQKELKEILTQRQEAVLVNMGMLE